MWSFQARDNAIHGQESAKLFSLGKFLPAPLIRVMAAMDPMLHNQYLTQTAPTRDKYLDMICAAFAKRLTVFSAGFAESVNTGRAVIWSPFEPFVRGHRAGPHVAWRQIDVQYFHRSIHDFLTGTEEGQEMVKFHKDWTAEAAEEAFAMSYMAAVIEGIENLQLNSVHKECLRVTNSEAKLRVSTYMIAVCEQLWRQTEHSKLPGNHGWVSFLQQWPANLHYYHYEHYPCEQDETGLAHILTFASDGTSRLSKVQENRYSAYYKGYLCLCLIQAYDNFSDAWLQRFRHSVLSLMANTGADMRTPRSILTSQISFAIRGPVLQVLARCLHEALLYSNTSISLERLEASSNLLSSLKKYGSCLETRDLTLIEPFSPRDFESGLLGSLSDDEEYLHVTYTFNARDVLRLLVQHYEGLLRHSYLLPRNKGQANSCSRQFNADSVLASESSLAVAESELRIEAMMLQPRINIVRHNVPSQTSTSAILSDDICSTIRTLFSERKASFFSTVWSDTEAAEFFSVELTRLLKSVSWTADLPDIQDVYFVKNGQRPQIVPLDPSANATMTTWKEVSSLRHYFTRLDHEDAVKKRLKSTMDPEKSKRQVYHSRVAPPLVHTAHSQGGAGTPSSGKSSKELLQRLQMRKSGETDDVSRGDQRFKLLS